MFAKFFLAHNGKRCSLVCQTDRYITEHPGRGTGMRMLKCYLANNREPPRESWRLNFLRKR